MTDNPFTLTMDERLALAENDEDNAARLLSAYGRDLLFVAGRGWAVWDGHRYSFRLGDQAAALVARKLRELVKAESEYAGAQDGWDPTEGQIWKAMKDHPKLCPHNDAARAYLKSEKATRLAAHAVKCGNLGKVKAVLEMVQPLVAREVGDLDRDPFQLITPNGQIDLLEAMRWEAPEGATEAEIAAARRSWMVAEVNRVTLPTRMASAVYSPKAACPFWLNFLSLIIPDQPVRECVQRIAGATLFGENRAQICVILRGPGGNGKSTLLNGLQVVLGARGGYAAPAPIEMFIETGQKNSGQATPDEVLLPGSRLVIATEPEARDTFSAKKIKGLTGGDRRISRPNYGEFFEWVPQFIPVLSCNRTPKIKDEDEGMRRRLVFVPLEVNLRTLPAEHQIPPGRVAAKIEAEASGILNWMIDGFRAFMAEGVNPPPVMLELKDTLMQAADPVGVFLTQMTVKAEGSRIRRSWFHQVFEAWAEAEGFAAYRGPAVREIMTEKGYSAIKSHGIFCWADLDWHPDAADLVEQTTGQRPASALPPEPPPDF